MLPSLRRAILILPVLTLAVEVRELGAQCVNTLNLSSGAGNTIRLSGIGISNAQLNDAAGYWAACPGYGNEFANFTTDANASANITVTVNYLGGNNSSCGEAAYVSATSLKINLWATTNTSGGQPVTCNVTDTLAHELGHILNLGNSSCQGYMMGPAPLTSQNGQLVAGTRSVQGEECSTVSGNWTNPGGDTGNNNPPPCV
jgi:hypothetical protein